MAIRVAINGYGRIGRMVLRALYESGRKDIEIIAINSSGGDAEENAHLTRYDSAHGRFPFDVGVDGDAMIINSHKIRTFSTRNPAELPWRDLGIDVVLECTGAFNSKAKAQAHIDAGAKKVLLSAPGEKDIDATVVYGVNHHVIKAEHTVISNASCTTNGLAPMVLPLHQKIGIENGLMNTIHSFTNDQVLTDAHHKDMRRARSATTSLIPTKTGAAAAVGLVLPELNGKLDGFAIRVPTINVSLVDLTFTPSRPTTKEEVNHIMHEAANSSALKGILSYNEAPLVSVDYNHTDFSSNFDATLTKVTKDGMLVKVCAWYDNEWGFSCRMLDNVAAMMAAK
ncbi:type I glyceraldehyde-3-phosphate dehydrogenase [Methylotenera mobilis]|uniref:Glyceraldehyde-3-phosphate dehydrogenase n=1 Tax=Methylotenera mobilis (strain JLW8 / ATCC BAA-1282 / DSM 17540) TaxID=583345 RepID=C6WYG3_METML|nr:type I glyceraldehyde-3-phosphate dehydrogenase [Methylotenera mobilis]ACT48882.1 glyceraldehyde-3-phosphate dehydrogenase, type I [Methylotenera mobilis JLW8]